MTDDDHGAKPGEQLWEHAHRLNLLALGKLTADILLRPTMREYSHLLGAYLSNYEAHCRGLRCLLRARDTLMMAVVWPQDGTGLLLDSEDVRHDIIKECGAAFVDSVNSWQPMMDSLATATVLLVREHGFKIKAAKSAFELYQYLEQKPSACVAHPAILAFTGRTIEWYVNGIRLMRNQFVHNERVAFIVPRADNVTAIVELKKLEHHQTSQSFDLDEFLSYTYARFLLFAHALVEGASQNPLNKR